MHTLMLSCRKASAFVEQRAVAPLGPVRGLQLWIHQRMCQGCRAFAKQSLIIDRALGGREINQVALDSEQLEGRILASIDPSGTL
jgi:hypothetical protein